MGRGGAGCKGWARAGLVQAAGAGGWRRWYGWCRWSARVFGFDMYMYTYCRIYSRTKWDTVGYKMT